MVRPRAKRAAAHHMITELGQSANDLTSSTQTDGT